jgi:hypothetical protein
MRKALRLLLAIGFLGFPLGCARLIVRDTDTLGTKSAKLGTRGVFAVATLSVSELWWMKEVKRSDQERRLHKYLKDRVGVMTLAQAMVHWGTPKSEDAKDQLVVAQWSSESTNPMWVPDENDRWVARPVQNGWNLRLSFAGTPGTPETPKRLSTFQYSEW